MKRASFVLVGGLVLALAGYAASYFIGSTQCRCMTRSATPELAWLQTEFHVSDADFARVAQLHENYRADCAERCRRVDAKNSELRDLLAATNAITPAIERTLQEAAQLRAHCQTEMLKHFYAVSRTMPPEQGRRYLAWVTSRTLGPQHATMTLDSSAVDHEHGHE
jgi:uncharacterized membrane protein